MMNTKVRASSLLSLIVVLLFFISSTAITYHHHDLGDTAHNDCPICATAHVTSFAEFDGSTPVSLNTSIAVLDPIPHDSIIYRTPAFLIHLNSRAPPIF